MEFKSNLAKETSVYPSEDNNTELQLSKRSTVKNESKLQEFIVSSVSHVRITGKQFFFFFHETISISYPFFIV